MLLGVGIDILSLPRLQALIQRRSPCALAKRICSPTELTSFKSLLEDDVVSKSNSSAGDQALRFLSTRWVLKEAAYKSISSRYPVGWKDLHVDHLPSGQPRIRYTPPPTPPTSIPGPEGDTRFDGMESHLDLMCTLSHDAGVVVGVVIAQTTVM